MEISEAPTVAILGGGYAGIQAAVKLSQLLRREWQILLIERAPSHQLLTRLPEVLGGRLHPDRCLIPYSRILPARVRVVHTDVVRIDPDHRRVFTSNGSLEAQYIVVALGSEADYHQIPGADGNIWEVRSVTDAARLHARLRRLRQENEHARIVLVGGGYTATEVAGHLADWKSRRRQSGNSAKMTIALVNDEPYLLHGANLRMSDVALRILRRKGVTVSLGVPVSSVDAKNVTLEDGTTLEADLVIWGAGSRAASTASSSGLPTGQDYRLVVDQYLRTGQSEIYAIGDSSFAHDYVADSPISGSAQVAVQEGAVAAENIAAEIRSHPPKPFRPRILGEALSLGGPDGVADVAGIILTGRAALAVKDAALLRYLRSLGGARLAMAYR